MARRPRLQFPGAIYHVMSRGNRKHEIFDDDDDRRRFLKILGQAVKRYEVRCFEYCLMRNHYHILMDTPRGNLSRALQHLNGCYAQSSNRRHGRTGHVFEGRFRSILIDRETYLRRAARYVVLNPGRAGLVTDPGAYAWSSYRATAGLAPAPPFLFTDWCAWAFGGTCREDACERYRAYVAKASAREAEIDLGALAIGRAAFVAAVEQAARMRTPELSLPFFSRNLIRPPLRELFITGQDERATRNRLVYQAHVTHGYRLVEIAKFLGVHPSTVSRIVCDRQDTCGSK